MKWMHVCMYVCVCAFYDCNACMHVRIHERMVACMHVLNVCMYGNVVTWCIAM